MKYLQIKSYDICDLLQNNPQTVEEEREDWKGNNFGHE